MFGRGLKVVTKGSKPGPVRRTVRPGKWALSYLLHSQFSPCLRIVAWPWKGEGGLIVPSLRLSEKMALFAPPSSTEME